MIKRKHFKLLGILFGAGALLNLFNSIVIRLILLNSSGWGVKESNILYGFDLCISLILLACIVLFFIRKINKLEVAKSAGIVFVYALIALAIEHITIKSIGYSTLLIWMFYPNEVFSFMLQGLLKLVEIPAFISFLIQNAFVFILVGFGKSSEKNLN